MTAMTLTAPAAARGPSAALRNLIVCVIGFLTLVDLFATQALLPTLAKAYHVAPSAAGVAVNASTFGMAAAGLIVALLSHRIPRRTGIWVALALLAIPTIALAFAPNLAVFTTLRVVQGLFMSSAFTLTMAYLAEHGTAEETASALAAYVTGAVASNLIGRLVASAVASHAGLAANFYVFAALNLVGAALVFVSLQSARLAPATTGPTRSPLARLGAHLAVPCLRACFGIGFCVLFAFIGAFTYVNFVLARAPIGLGPMALGLVYLVFLPSMVTTPVAGRIANRLGPRPAFWGSLGLACLGLPLILLPNLVAIVIGLTLLGVGTFFAQAVATGFVGRAAKQDRAAASGIYLAAYYLGGLAGAFILGQVFDHIGWPATVAGIGLALLAAAAFAARLRPETAGDKAR
ncbi:MAG TPA: MFS transporter [Caulobacteraceae bacterium]|jgi:predicted MFS family arabinose efflux permease|nr:MFS transporter [Caulobacteraceae bacterium]